MISRSFEIEERMWINNYLNMYRIRITYFSFILIIMNHLNSIYYIPVKSSLGHDSYIKKNYKYCSLSSTPYI